MIAFYKKEIKHSTLLLWDELVLDLYLMLISNIIPIAKFNNTLDALIWLGEN